MKTSGWEEEDEEMRRRRERGREGRKEATERRD